MTLDEALDEVTEPKTIEVQQPGGVCEVDVVDCDRLGVRVSGVRKRHTDARDIVLESGSLPGRLRSLKDQVKPVEVDAELGGAVLRSDVEEGYYFEVEVRPNQNSVRRTKVGENHEREGADWTLTREDLRRLVKEL